MKNACLFWIIPLLMFFTGCTDKAWNNPYTEAESGQNIYYDLFSERPKHLDPVRSYAANEYVFLGQIYEPPLQYHFLKRPYELVPLTVTGMPEVSYFDTAGNRLDEGVAAEKVKSVEYTIHLQPGIIYQPHPAFARDEDGNYLYLNLTTSDLSEVHNLGDFTHTGTRELVADDYAYQIKRMAHPRTHSPIAGVMKHYIAGLDELTQELQEYSNSDEFIDLRDFEMSGVTVMDKYTFKITLKEKYPQFIYWLAMYFFAPMPWEADWFYSQPGMDELNVTLDWYPVGTGPFMLTENNPNRRMVLEKNPNFRGELYPFEGEEGDREAGLLVDAGKPMPFIDKAIYSLEKESIPAWNKFLQGYYDTSGIVSDSFDQAIQFNTQGNAELTPDMKKKNINLTTAVTTTDYYMGFNMKDDIVGGDSERARLLRRAISIAIDYEEYNAIFANGRALPAQGPIPPGIFGYKNGEESINPYVYEWVEGKPKRKSIEEARQLMVEAGYPAGRNKETGQALILYLDATVSGPGAKALFDWYRKQFAKLGINLVVRSTDYNRFQEKLIKGTAQIYTLGWNADYPDPENFLFLLYGPNGKVDMHGENASNYENADFDRLFVQMKSMDNGPQRQQILDEMVEILRRDAPWLWGFHPIGFSLYHDWYKNSKPNLMANNGLKYKRIDPVLRKQYRMSWNRPVIYPVIILMILLLISFIPAWYSYRRKEKSTAL